MTLRFIRPGKPIENAYVESFNGKFRDECLNEHWFVSLADAKATIEAWRVDYNTVRPHSSLDGATPHHFATITEGARRLTPARPAMKTLNPRTSHYPCSGYRGQVTTAHCVRASHYESVWRNDPFIAALCRELRRTRVCAEHVLTNGRNTIRNC